MLRRFVFVLGALLLVGIGFGLPAQAGYTPPSGISIDKPIVDPGESVTVTGEGCAADVEVTILLGETQVATATTAADGTFSATFEVPPGTAAGTYTVDAVDCTVEVLSTTLTVRAAATTATTDRHVEHAPGHRFRHDRDPPAGGRRVARLRWAAGLRRSPPDRHLSLRCGAAGTPPARPEAFALTAVHHNRRQ